jgi:hypothetical protein
MPSELQMKHTLHLARKAIFELKQSLAFELLRSIQNDVEILPHTSVSAEHQLLYADALALSKTTADAAESEFRSALQQICDLQVSDVELEMRGHEDYGNYLARFKRLRSRAREQYQSAKRLAVQSTLLEDSSRLELSIIKIDLESDESPQITAFQNFKKAAAELGCTFQEQLAGWMVFSGEFEEQVPTLVAARNAGKTPVDYFRGLLKSIKSNPQ